VIVSVEVKQVIEVTVNVNELLSLTTDPSDHVIAPVTVIENVPIFYTSEVGQETVLVELSN